MQVEHLERPYDQASTASCAQDTQRDRRLRSATGVHADAILQNTIWFETGVYNTRERSADHVAA